MSVNFVERDGQRFALVPAEIYERMLDDLDDLDDIRAYDAAKAKAQEFVPAAIADRLIAGENPVRVWREYRGLTPTVLAERVGITPPYLSQLEHDRRRASHVVLRRLATALQVDIDDLVKPEATS
jgi:DNA-binding XRE family transcriptional regulator